MNEALEAARGAWASPDLGPDDEQAIWARYGGSFTAADHDTRVDALLFAKKPNDAARFYSSTSPTRRAAFAARIAMQRNASDAERLYQAVIGMVTSDAGLDDGPRTLPSREQLRTGRATARCPAPPVRLHARRPGALLRHAPDAGERGGPGSAVGHRLQYRPPPARRAPARHRHQPCSHMRSATITRR